MEQHNPSTTQTTPPSVVPCETHQRADISKNITFRLDPFREDYEIRDGHGKCRGFIWTHDGGWVCRVDELNAQYCDTLLDAKELVMALVKGTRATTP